MADNVTFQTSVTATPPNATTVATDDVSGVQYQKVKLDIGGDGVSSPLTSANPMPVVGSVQTIGTSQALGTVQLVGTVPIGTIAGTVASLGTFQPLAGSVHVANPVDVTPASPAANDYLPVRLTDGATFYTASGGAGGGASATDQTAFGAGVTNTTPIAGIATIQAIGQGSIGALAMDTSRVLYTRGTVDGGTVNIGGTVSIGTIAGTISALGTFQPLAGSVHLANTFPGGTIHIGTIAGTISVGTIAGTVSALGTFQPLAGSVHLATNLAGGTIVSVGSAIHDAVADTRPHLIGGFGSSGTQAAVNDGDAVRAWFDLNGRQVMRGTIDSMPAVVITSGTVGLAGGTQHIGSVQRITGGTIDFIGGTVNIGTLQGTIHIGSVQRIGGGTIDQLNGTVRGTVSIAGTAPLGTLPGGTVVALSGGFGSYFGTSFTAAVALGTLIAPPASGTRWRLYDLTISASAAGTVLLQEAASAANGTVVWGPLFFAANGGMVQASARGLPARVTAQGLFCSVSAGTVAVTVNYGLET